MDVSKTSELIAWADREHERINEVPWSTRKCIEHLADALEAATRVPVQGESNVLTFEEAREVACVLSARGEFADGITVESIWARGAVWGALGGDRRNYVAVQGEPNDDREALAKIFEPVEALIDGAGAFELGYELADAALAAGFSRATVPDAATERVERMHKISLQLVEATEQRDAALAAVERVRAVVKQWSPAESYGRDEVLRALDGAPGDQPT